MRWMPVLMSRPSGAFSSPSRKTRPGMSSSRPERRRRWNVLRRCSPPAAGLHDAVEQLQGDEFLAGDDHVGAVSSARARAEEVPRLVDGLGAAGQDERPVLAQLVGVGDHLIGAGAVDLHAGDEQHLRDVAVQAGLAGPEIAVPLPQHDARPREAGGVDAPAMARGPAVSSRMSANRNGPSRVR